MQKSETIGELGVALVKVQGQLQPASKNSRNPFFNSDYADLNSVWSACRSLLADAGLSIVQTPTNPPADYGAHAVSLTTMLVHVSGEWIMDTVTAPLTKSDAQGVGSALTYLRRYGLAAMVGIVTGDDDDGNISSGRNRKPEQEKATLNELRRRFHATGNEVYGDGWDDKRHELCQFYHVESSNDLTAVQLKKLVDGMSVKSSGPARQME